MKGSSLAECLEEFEATNLVMGAPKENARAWWSWKTAARRVVHHAASRSTSRRIQIRDTGLRHFRVF